MLTHFKDIHFEVTTAILKQLVYGMTSRARAINNDKKGGIWKWCAHADVS
jgi:hypothetical protein